VVAADPREVRDLAVTARSSGGVVDLDEDGVGLGERLRGTRRVVEYGRHRHALERRFCHQPRIAEASREHRESLDRVDPLGPTVQVLEHSLDRLEHLEPPPVRLVETFDQREHAVVALEGDLPRALGLGVLGGRQERRVRLGPAFGAQVVVRQFGVARSAARQGGSDTGVQRRSHRWTHTLVHGLAKLVVRERVGSVGDGDEQARGEERFQRRPQRQGLALAHALEEVELEAPSDDGCEIERGACILVECSVPSRDEGADRLRDGGLLDPRPARS
jgi:hypothetical protein